MHFLDLIMYFVCAIVLWFILDKLFGGEITQEIGGLIGMLIMIIFTIIYVIMFFFMDYNWIDFNFQDSGIKDFFKL